VTLESELRPGLTTVVGWDTRWYRYTGGPLAEDLLPFSRNGHMTAIGDLFHNGLFGQLTGRFGDLTLHLGGRFDDFSDHVRSLFVPRLALGYRFNDRWQAKVLYTEGALRPSWVQIGAWFSVDSTDIDTSLEPEESRTIELSTALDLDDFAATVSAYRTRVAGAINFVRGPRGWGFYNYADYTTWGVEVESKLRLGHHLEMFLNLTGYFDAARSEKVELVVPEPGGGDSWGAVKGEDDAYNLPPVFLAGGATLRLPLGDRRLELTPILRYRGKRTLQGIPGQASDIDVDTLMADLKGRLVLGPKLELTLNGRNVLDERGVVGVSSGRAGFAIPQGPVWEAGVQTRF
jgi:outer membrane receptor protein involved in Fe transport